MIYLYTTKPYLSESQFVIRQHADTAIGIIDKVLNPQWARQWCVGGIDVNEAADAEMARQE